MRTTDHVRPFPRRGAATAARIAAIVTLGALLAGCSPGVVRPPEVGSPAPAFALRGLDGETVTLGALTGGRAVLLNFWASWCAPCKAEVPVLNEIHERYAERGLSVVGIAVGERQDVVEAFMRRHELRYPVLLDGDSSVARRYGLIGVPMNILVDRDGIVSIVKTGSVDDAMLAALEELPEGLAPASHH
jgi:cytochrome c biogenesis protein CcmG/thiol:disulfide interchange protein DsbE